MTRTQIDHANPQAVLDVIDSWKRSAKDMLSHADTYRQAVTLPGGQPWSGETRDAAVEMARKDHAAIEHMRESTDAMADAAANGVNFTIIPNLNQVRAQIAEAESHGFQVNDDLSVIDLKKQTDDTPDPKRTQARDNCERDIKVSAQKWWTSDLAVATQIDKDKKDVSAKFTNVNLTGVTPPLAPGGDQNSVVGDERRQNQIDAFRKVFGRDPVSKSDWTTAASLDPHTYDPKFKGKESQVKVYKIKPVPGQGVVRSSQWIEQRNVVSWPPPQRDLGNNRGPNPNFDPEDTKVTMTVDYDNGVVVVRQNPSVRENPDGSSGEVNNSAAPSTQVFQAPDGSVRIKYDAHDPYADGAPGGRWAYPDGPLGDNRVSVNGDLVFTPGAAGVQVSGTRTDYPSMEIYEDMPDGGSHTVMVDHARSGRMWGPIFNLEGHHQVGPQGGSALDQFHGTEVQAEPG